MFNNNTHTPDICMCMENMHLIKTEETDKLPTEQYPCPWNFYH